jgi:prophage maintenance system killer protein
VRLWHERIFGPWFPEQAGRQRVGEAFAALREEIEERDAAVASERQPKLRDATLPAAKFYAKLLSTHPFFDGNGRVAYVALQYALVRLVR